MLELRELMENDKFRGVEISSKETVPLILRDGRALAVAIRYTHEEGRPHCQQALLEGIVLGVTHCTLVGRPLS